VIHEYLAGHHLEYIEEAFPMLSTAQILAAIEFYQQHRAAIDAELAAARRAP
jgi:uncharacterized protein (DUF433 family)